MFQLVPIHRQEAKHVNHGGLAEEIDGSGRVLGGSSREQLKAPAIDERSTDDSDARKRRIMDKIPSSHPVHTPHRSKGMRALGWLRTRCELATAPDDETRLTYQTEIVICSNGR